VYAYLKGTLVETSPHNVIIDVHGVGYKVFIPVSILSSLPQIGQEVVLHTSYVVREFAHALYGFITPQERTLFDVLTGINGIGPKVALSIIGHLPLKEFQRAINCKDIVTLSKVPGIGKRRQMLPAMSDFTSYLNDLL